MASYNLVSGRQLGSLRARHCAYPCVPAGGPGEPESLSEVPVDGHHPVSQPATIAVPRGQRLQQHGQLALHRALQPATDTDRLIPDTRH